MKKSSLRKKSVIAVTISLTIFVLFSILMSYLFYTDAIEHVNSSNAQSSKTMFFVIFTCAEILIAVVIVAIILFLIEINVISPIEKINEAVDDIFTVSKNGNGIEFNENSAAKFKELNINTKDEIETLYETLGKMQLELSDCVTALKEDNWEAEHDNMTMLSNRLRFNKRKDRVYPYCDSIYIVCIDVINMKLVNERLSTEAGDSIITKVARELRRLSSESIHTYRLEEDKFLVVLCGYSEDDAFNIVNTWNARVGRLNRATDNFDCRIVFGGAYAENDFEVDDVIKRADAEMYCQKMVVKGELGNAI